MKAIRALAMLLAVLALAGCGKKVVDGSKLVERNGLKYEVNSERPFTGKMVLYYPKGQMKAEVEFRDGKMEGKRTLWYENGQKEDESEFRDGKAEGKFTMRYENGQKRVAGEYRDGKPQGTWTLWSEDGKELGKHVIERNKVSPSRDRGL